MTDRPAAVAATRLLRPALVVVGAGFVGYLIYEVGAATVWRAVGDLSWRLLIVLCFPYPLVAALDTLAWRFAFARDTVSFPTLLGARLAGEAINLTTPTASVGGEPVKAFLLSPRVPLGEGLASVIVDKTTLTLGQVLFLASGLLLGGLLLSLSAPLLVAMVALLAFEIVAVGGFLLAQTRGMFGGGGRILSRLGLAPAQRHQASLDDLDRSLAGFYRSRRDRLGWSVFLHLLAAGCGSLEIYVVLNFLGVPVSLATAFAAESFGAAVKFASFMIPASLGALEGGNVAIFESLGLGGAVGLAYTLIRRLREAAWAGLGLLALASLNTRPAGVGGRVEA